MQEDFLARVGDMLKAANPACPEAMQDADERAYAMLLMVTAFIRSRIGPGQALRLAAEAIDNTDAAKTGLLSDTSNVTRFAELLLDLLRQRRADDPKQAAAGHCEAAAMILAGGAFLQERHGGVHMGGFMGSVIQELQRLMTLGQYPLSPPAEAVPVLPPPPGTPVFSSTPRTGTTLTSRINTMSDFLRGAPQADAQSDALASIMAATLFLRERYGEGYVVGALRQAEGVVSQAAVLDRWQPEGAARH